MKYRNVGQTGITCSVIGLGTHQFSGEWGQSFSNKDVSRLFSKAQELGINVIDTAPSYGSHYSEKLIGKAIEKRDDWIIATKFGQKYNSISNKTEFSFDIKQVKKQFKKSLLSLDTDYIDIYQFHSGTNKDFMNEDIWSYLNKKVDEGKIKSLGVSIAHNLVEENDNLQVELSKDYGIQVIQTVYNRLSRQSEKSLFPLCQRNDLGIIGRVPLAKGFLSGKYSKKHIFSSSDHRSKFGSKTNSHLLSRVDALRSEVPEDVPMSQWALSWCLKNKSVSMVIPGAKNISQLESNAQASNYI